MASIELNKQELEYIFYLLPPSWETNAPQVNDFRHKIAKALEMK